MTPELFLREFLAVNLHFNRNGNYDYFKYGGKTRYNPDSLTTRKDRFALKYFSSNETQVEFRDRVVAYNFYEGKNAWSTIELKSPPAKEHYKRWQENTINLRKNIEKDLLGVDNMKDYVMITDKSYLPDIITDVIGERISPHTFMSVDRVLKLTDRLYDKHYGKNMIYHNSVFLLRKASPFIMTSEENANLIKGKL